MAAFGKRTWGGAVLVLAMTACGAHGMAGVPTPTSSRPAGLGSHVSRDVVIGEAERQSNQVHRIEAKLTRYAAWKASLEDPLSGPVNPSLGELVWIVAISGTTYP